MDHLEEIVGAREKIMNMFGEGPLAARVADEILAEHRMEIAAEIREYTDTLRAEDWGKSNRTKVSWLRAIGAIRKNVILKGVDLKKVQ